MRGGWRTWLQTASHGLGLTNPVGHLQVYYHNTLSGESSWTKPQDFKGEDATAGAQPVPVSSTDVQVLLNALQRVAIGRRVRCCRFYWKPILTVAAAAANLVGGSQCWCLRQICRCTDALQRVACGHLINC